MAKLGACSASCEFQTDGPVPTLPFAFYCIVFFASDRGARERPVILFGVCDSRRGNRDPFELTKYPVTNGQFYRFVEPGGGLPTSGVQPTTSMPYGDFGPHLGRFAGRVDITIVEGYRFGRQCSRLSLPTDLATGRL